MSWYEADAYARWAGLRLPTEPEWERAAVWDEVDGRARRWPWVRATSRRVRRATFRNWDLPQPRQIFAGVRCARDA